MYCLLDANNFYVSAERIFRPALEGVPVIVLSNNDGCAISRSEEAKALGITMGMPYFQIRQQMPNALIVALSANYGLYGAISTRLMSLAAGLGPSQEIYSIDETFIGLHGLSPFVVELIQDHQLKVQSADALLAIEGKPSGDRPIGDQPSKRMICVKCKQDVMVLRKGPHGPFLSCNRYPACRSTAKP